MVGYKVRFSLTFVKDVRIIFYTEFNSEIVLDSLVVKKMVYGVLLP
jgi:hypothetical protein